MARRKRDRGGERAPTGPLALGAGPGRPSRIAAGLALVAAIAGLAAVVTLWRGRSPRSDAE